MIDEQKSERLKAITKRLELEKPVILHDAHDSGEYILFLKGLTQITRNRDLSSPMMQDPVAAYLKSIEQVIPFFIAHGLMTSECDFHRILTDNQEITGLAIPAGAQAQEAISKLYHEYGQTNPFTYVEAHADHGMVKTVLELQGLDRPSAMGVA